MIRSIVILLILLGATLFLPLWVQISLFVLAMFVIKHKLLLFIPAVFSDVLYGPVGQFSLQYIYMTLLVAGLLIIHWFIFTKTRLGQIFYGLETK